MLQSFGRQTLLESPPLRYSVGLSFVTVSSSYFIVFCQVAEADVLKAANQLSVAELLEIEDGADLVRKLWKAVPPVPLESMAPMTIIYTSGTSGLRPRVCCALLLCTHFLAMC